MHSSCGQETTPRVRIQNISRTDTSRNVLRHNQQKCAKTREETASGSGGRGSTSNTVARPVSAEAVTYVREKLMSVTSSMVQTELSSPSPSPSCPNTTATSNIDIVV